MKNTTIKDVAARAGVSISAVSYIVSNSTVKKYSEETVARVKLAARELNYAPTNIARGMRSQKSFAIGIVSFWDMDNRVFVKTLEGIVEQTNEAGYSTIICPVRLCKIGGIQENDFSYLDFYINKRIDGVIFISPASIERKINETEHIARMKQIGVPNVIINGGTREADVNYIYYNFFNTTYLAAKYLLERGFDRISYVSPEPMNGFSELTERLNGYLAAVREFAVKPEVFNIDEVDAVLLRSMKAVVTNKSEVARRILNLALDCGIRVPDALSVVSANVENYSEFLYPPLTCVQLPFKKMGMMAVKRLIQNINDKPIYESITPECEICEGGSVLFKDF